MLQLLVHLVRHARVVLETGHGDRLFPVSLLFHRLFEHCMHHAKKVPCQIRPGSPTRDGLHPQPLGHQTLQLHQPTASSSIDLTTGRRFPRCVSHATWPALVTGCGGFGPGCEHTSEDHGEELADLVFSCAVGAGRGEGFFAHFRGVRGTLCRLWAFLVLLALDVARTLFIEFENSLVAAAEVTCVVPAQTEISDNSSAFHAETVHCWSFALLPVRPGLHSTDRLECFRRRLMSC